MKYYEVKSDDLDEYFVVTEEGEVYTMDKDAMSGGVNQYIGTTSQPELNEATLGHEVPPEEVPSEVKEAAVERTQ